MAKMTKLKGKMMKKKKVEKKYGDNETPMFQFTLDEEKIEKLVEASEDKAGLVLNVDDQVVIFIKYKDK